MEYWNSATEGMMNQNIMKLLMEITARKSTPTSEGNGRPEMIGTLQNNRVTKPPEGKKIIN